MSSTVFIYYSNVVFKDIALSLEFTLNKTLPRGNNVILTHKLDSNNSNLWIILGANELPPSTLLPPNYIIYQLEQISLKDNKWLTEKYIQIMRNAKMVWDYSKKNTFVLQSLQIKTFLVPIAYTTTLHTLETTSETSSNNLETPRDNTRDNTSENTRDTTRDNTSDNPRDNTRDNLETTSENPRDNLEINREKEKDIDFLFIGSLNPRRLHILNSLKLAGYNVMSADGSIWGLDRSKLLLRSKCVLNIHYYNEDSPLEMARLSILLANKSFIISEYSGDSYLDKPLEKGVVFCYYKDFIKTCIKYIDPSQETKRNSIANKGFSIFSKTSYNIPNGFIKMVKLYSNTSSVIGKEGYEMKPVSDKDTIDKIPLLIDSDGLGPEALDHSVGDGYSSIKLPPYLENELPSISLVTPTKNRKYFISFLIHQVLKLDYPKDKLEWIIIDDSDNYEDFEYISNTLNILLKPAYTPERSGGVWAGLKNKLKFQCIYLEPCKEKNTISYKRNHGVSLASYDYIAHIDDDDYYFPHCLKTKIAFLINNPNKHCIGTTELPVYNLINDSSILTKTNHLAEATMLYKKSFWTHTPFSEHLNGEGYAFTIHRRNELLDIPYLYSIIAINHGKNITGKTRLFNPSQVSTEVSKRESNNTITNLFDAMDEESQDILASIKTVLRLS
jgi:hypothetical protein